LTDAQLIQRIVQRDASALSELYDRYATRVYSLCVSIVQDDIAAEEATQDVFLKIWNHPERYRFDDNRFVAWLLTLARHRALDHVRHTHRRVMSVHSLDDDTFPELPDLQADEQARWNEMQHAMQSLPEEQRRVIALAYYHGMSQSDISAHLDIPLGTVKTRLRLGMEKLREAFLKD
jgi:RNA polymerase sigma-70 factor (ECF subfamily)